MTYNFPAQIYYFDCESGCGNVWKKHQTDQLPVQRTADGLSLIHIYITTDEGMNRILKGIKLIRYGIFFGRNRLI